ncbi:MAG: MFS transporter, partial [Anaerovorax sp.]
MEEEEGWSSGALGITTGILFWTYGMGHLFNGRLGEIFGVNRFIIAGVILTAAANVLISFQSSIIIIAIIWGFNGYFQSMLWSPAMALVSNWWPGNSRGFATGFANASSGMGSVIASFLVVGSLAIAPEMGWRAAFRFPVIIMVIIVIAYAILVKASPKSVGLEEYKETDEAREVLESDLKKVMAEKGKLYPYIYLFSKWRFDLWLIIIAGSSIARYGLITWMPKYYVDVFGVDLKAGILGTVFLPLGMAIGTFVIPWITDKYCPTNRLPAVILCAAVGGATVFFFPMLGPGIGAGIVLFIAGFFIYAINGLVWAYATDIGGRVFGGTAAGILDCAAYLGASAQAVCFGMVLNTGQWNLVFTMIVVVCVIIILAAIAAGWGLNKKKTIV